MLFYLSLGLGGFLAIFFLRQFRKVLYHLAERSLGLLNVLLNTESDEVKLPQMESATARLVVSLLKSTLLFAMAGMLIYLPYLLLSFFPGLAPVSRSAGWEILALSAGASVPFFIPLRKTPSGYSELSVLLHRLILNHYSLGLRLLRRERRMVVKKGILPRNRFVIVTGLARAGTTSMMNRLAELAEFSSLSYANMPFLLSPRTWARIYHPKNESLQERSHKDGVHIGLKSTEALEEYFFKAISKDAYVLETALQEYAIGTDEYQAYLEYQAVVRNSDEQIYLAKNNNFLLRYKSMRRLNPDFLLVLMFRHPLYHASSLLEKHRQYSELQKEDPFVLEYMNWLGHHEFGLNHKPMLFDGQSLPVYSSVELNYWLESWCNYYHQVLNIDHNQVLLINYEDFCNKPASALNLVIGSLELEQRVLPLKPFKNKRQSITGYDAALLQQAEIIYEQLLKLAQTL